MSSSLSVPHLVEGRQALFLDFDGTLVNLAARPEEVSPDAGLPTLLAELQIRLGGALAVLTGRRIESVDHFLAPLKFAGAGLHGAQRREEPGGTVIEVATETGLARTLQAAIAPHDGLWIEDKGAAIAIHYRAVPALGDFALRLLGDAAAANPQLQIVSGKFVHELRPRGLDKGEALREFMRRPPFAGRQPVFVGDDQTDEDAIRVAQELGGIGIRVGPGETLAAYRLLDPQAVLLWLRAAIATVPQEA